MNKLMRKALAILSVMLVMGSTVYGSTSSAPLCVEARNPHQVRFGLEAFGFNLNTRVNHIDVKGTSFFSGSELAYNYLSPNTVYFGVDLQGAGTGQDFDANFTNGAAVNWNNASKQLLNAELRAGYTWAGCQSMVTPFVGIGIYDLFNVDHYNDQGFKEVLPYVAVGIKSLYYIDRDFSIGINLKTFATFSAYQEFEYAGGSTTQHRNTWGGEIGVPLTWYLGQCKKWDLSLEPYAATLDFASTQNMYGARLTAGYRF